MKNNAYKNVAKVTKKIGKSGKVAVEALGNLPFLLTEGMRVFLTPPVLDGINETAIISIEKKGNTFVVAFSGSKNTSDAFSLVGRTCLVAESELRELDNRKDDKVNNNSENLGATRSIADASMLLGFYVEDASAGFIGKVSDILQGLEQTTLAVSKSAGENEMVEKNTVADKNETADKNTATDKNIAAEKNNVPDKNTTTDKNEAKNRGGVSAGKEILIPFVDEFIVEIQKDKIRVDVPYELLTLNEA